MKTRWVLILLFICYTLTNTFAADTIRYEIMQLEKINVDTVQKIDNESYIGCVNLRFRLGVDSTVNFSYFNIMSYNSTKVMYYWTKVVSKANFALTEGLYYRLYVIPVCRNEIESESFYAKLPSFSPNNCTLSKLFDVRLQA